MSIYATLASFALPHLGPLSEWPDNYTGITIQAVPAHINYTGETWGFLPPPVPEECGLYRAVFVCAPWTKKGASRCGQEYVDPLFMLTGEEYAAISWDEMWERISRGIDSEVSKSRRKHNRFTREELDAREKSRPKLPA